MNHLKITLLPYEKITIHSPLTPDKLVSRLVGVTEPDRSTLGFMKFPSSDKHFFGQVTPTEFKLERIIRSGRNDFQPVLVGEIAPFERGSIIYLKLRMTWQSILVFGIGFAFSAIITIIVTLIYLLKPNEGFDFLAFAGFTLLVYLFDIIPYNIGAKKSKALFFKIIGYDNVE